MFEIKARAASGRVGRWQIGKYSVTTPTLAVVVTPNSRIVSLRDIKKIGAEIIITNAYIMKKSEHAEQIEKKGVHKFYGWDGPIYTDSGTFQMYSQGKFEITPQETLEFQKSIGSDVITPLDLFTLPTDSKEVAREKLKETILRIRSAREIIQKQQLCGPVQGGAYPELRKKAALEVSKANPDIFAIGGIVPMMEQYRFSKLVEAILSARRNLDTSKPLHAFGAGHPMIFALLAAIGIDFFDSAAYAIFARQGRYLTVNGTKAISELHELPCSCPVCSENTARELAGDTSLLAKHNLYATFEEIKTIRQAIFDGSLWELLEQRIRSHPAMLEAYKTLGKYRKFLETSEPVSSKHAFFYLGKESLQRPAVFRAKNRLAAMKFTKKDETFGWLGLKVPLGLKMIYPFGQSVIPGQKKSGVAKPIDAARQVISYQYRMPLLKAKKAIGREGVAEISRNTGRLQRLKSKDMLLGTFRDSDGYFVPTFAGAKELAKQLHGAYTVHVNKDVESFIREGKTLFSKFVAGADDKIRPGDEVFVVGSAGELLATGTALLNSREMTSFKYGIAVDTRHIN
ncbi:tRNA-guanine(15) transglycosylase [uncultured archaeon]|nr:tRNA-guanine(15) transglycosylase [uncultured archaeon]